MCVAMWQQFLAVRVRRVCQTLFRYRMRNREARSVSARWRHGTIVEQLEIKQSNDGFQRLERLVNLYGADNVRLNIERSDGLLVDWMLAQGWALHVTPSVVVAHRCPRRFKSNPSDAYLLAHLLRLQDPDCRPLTRASSLVLHLRELAWALDKTIVDQRRQIADAPPFQGQSGWKGVRKEQQSPAKSLGAWRYMQYGKAATTSNR